MLATMVWCSFSSELRCENSCRGVSGWPQGIRASARPLWCTCQVHKVTWLHDFHENVLLCLWVPGPLQTDAPRHPHFIHVIKSLSMPSRHFYEGHHAHPAPHCSCTVHDWNIVKGKQHVQEMVLILYFSVVKRGKTIIFGHKFLTMAQEAYVIAQPGSLLHLSHGKIILRFQPKTAKY